MKEGFDMRKLQRCLILPIFLITILESSFAFGDELNIDDIVGAYNHLTISLSLMEHGVSAAGIRQDILSNIALGQLPETLLKDYKALIQLADKIAIKERDSLAEQKVRKELVAQKASQKAREDLVKLGTVGFAAYLTANISPILPLLSTLSDYPNTMEIPPVSMERLVSTFQQDISKLDFDLALRREQLIQQFKIDPHHFIKPENINEYLAIKKAGLSPDEYFRRLSSVQLNCPAFYLASFELAGQMMAKKDFNSAKANFESVLAFAPAIVRTLPMRSYAQAYLGILQSYSGECDEAFGAFSKALEELPSNQIALNGRATCYHKQKQYDKAITDYESVLGFSKDDALLNYNYACALSMAGRSHDQVIKQLKRALNAGFNNIRHAQQDPDFESIKNDQRMRELLAIEYSYAVEWNLLMPDKFILTNKSEFNLTNVKIGVTHSAMGSDQVNQ